MIERLVDPEVVFEAGNLVHGTHKTSDDSLRSFLDEGIKPGRLVGSIWRRPDMVAFGMLMEQDTPDRYIKASHYGPRFDTRCYSADRYKLGIVVDRRKMLERFAGQLNAVGFCWTEGGDVVENFLVWIGARRRFAYGIPINILPGVTVLKTEVRLFPLNGKADESITVKPDTYLGLVVLDVSFDWFMASVRESGSQIVLPVFSPECELMGVVGEWKKYY